MPKKFSRGQTVRPGREGGAEMKAKPFRKKNAPKLRKQPKPGSLVSPVGGFGVGI